MTKGEAYLRAWKLGFKGDFSEIDEIYHPEYSAIDLATGVKVDLNMDKTIGSELGKSMIIGPQTILFEDENKVKIQTFDKYKDADIFQIITSEITYKDGKIDTQKTVAEELDYDPSEGEDWNWEDYEQCFIPRCFVLGKTGGTK